MAVDRAISINLVRSELKSCEKDALRFGWDIFAVREEDLSFGIKMISPMDGEIYLIEIQFDNYKEWPFYIEFVDPLDGKMGTKNAYPSGKNDSFFNFHNGMPLICHPSSRKAYSDLQGPHGDWKLIDWENNSKTGALRNIHAILLAIYERISQSEIYKGRMK